MADSLIVQKFRKRPLLVDAVTVPVLVRRSLSVAKWCGGSVVKQASPASQRLAWIQIPTPDGYTRAKPGDWIIRDADGSFHTCRNDIFEDTYAAARDDWMAEVEHEEEA